MAFWNFQSCWVLLHIFSSSHMWNCGFMRTITFGNIFKPHWKLWKMACLAPLLGLPSQCTCGRKWFSRKRPFFPPSWTDWKLFDHDEEDAAAIQIHGIWGACMKWWSCLELLHKSFLTFEHAPWSVNSSQRLVKSQTPSYEAYLSYLPIIAHPLRHLLEEACSPDARFFSIRGSLISRGKERRPI